jgi:penicillin-binding protein 1A
MDPHTGRVLALSGGYSFWVSQYNTATQANRQPGSAFKPFVYLAGLDSGFTPSTIILDAPVVLKIDGWGKYKPRNYSGKFYGPTTMRRGLELSRNLMTIRLAQRTGLDKVSEYGVKLGVADKLPPELAMALGAYETTPLRMATAYSMIVNGGKKITPTLVDRIQDRYGKTIFRHGGRTCRDCTGVEWKNQDMPALPDNREQIADPRSAFQVVSMLQGVVQRGTGNIVASVGKPLAGKTGTTNDTLDAWFVGFSPDLVVAVWVGFDKPRQLGPREQGAMTAAPIFRDFMAEALKDKPATPFRVPKGLVTVQVSLDTGLPTKGDNRAIYEYFKSGKEPTERGAQGPDGVQNFDGFKRNPLAGTGETY